MSWTEEQAKGALLLRDSSASSMNGRARHNLGVAHEVIPRCSDRRCNMPGPAGKVADSLAAGFSLRAARHICASQLPESMFDLSVGSKSVELQSTSVGSFAIYPVSGLTQIRIHAGFDVRWVDVRPLAAGVRATVSANHRDVSFSTADATPLTVEFNDDLGHVVHLFPYAASVDEPNAARDHLRYFGPGRHDAGLIELQDGDAVYLAAGAWVKGAIRAKGVKDIAVSGHGVLDASGIEDGKMPYGGRSPIYLEQTQNAHILGITILNSHDWTVYLRQSDNAHINGIKVLNPGSWNGDDGIDLVSSSHVIVENVFVRTNDDCVVIKNLADVDTSEITVRHSVFWNMPNGGNGVEIGFETRSHPVHDIRFEDLDMIHVERGSAISIHNGDSAAVKDVSYDDIRVEDVRRKLIDFAIVYAPYGADRPATEKKIRERMDRGGTWDAALCYKSEEKAQLFSRRGTIRNVRVSRLRVLGGSLPYSVVAGVDAEHGVEGVILEDVEYQGRKLADAAALKLVVDNVSGVEIR